MTNDTTSSNCNDEDVEIRTRLTLGMAVVSRDGPWGEVGAIIVNPAERRVTHLVVEPHRRHHRARLIPVDAIATCDDHVTLKWSAADVDSAELVEETEWVPLAKYPRPGEGWDVGVNRVLIQPYIGVSSSYAFAAVGNDRLPSYATNVYDRIPTGTAEIREASDIRSHDDHIVGHVEALVVDEDETITDLVLDRGHLWRHREVTIPISEVDVVVTDTVRLRANRVAIDAMPSVRHHRDQRAS